jgi:hypothetical protein
MLEFALKSDNFFPLTNNTYLFRILYAKRSTSNHVPVNFTLYRTLSMLSIYNHNHSNLFMIFVLYTLVYSECLKIHIYFKWPLFKYHNTIVHPWWTQDFQKGGPPCVKVKYFSHFRCQIRSFTSVILIFFFQKRGQGRPPLNLPLHICTVVINVESWDTFR